MNPSAQTPATTDPGTAARPAAPARPERWRPDALRRRLLGAADVATGLGSAVVIGLLPGTGARLLPLLLVIPLTWIVVAKLHGLYDRDHRVLRPLTVDEFPRLLSCATMATAIIALVGHALDRTALTAGDAIRLWLMAIVAAPLLRAAARQLWRQVTPAEATVIVGHGPLADATRRKLSLFGDIHSDVVGVVSESALAGFIGSTGRELLLSHSAGRRVDRILVSSSAIDESLIAALVRFCRAEGIKLGVVPPARGMFGTAVQLDHVAELPIVQYNTWDIPRSTELLKRALDVVVSAAALLLLSPLLLAIAVLVRLDSRGPAFFVQRRAGRDGAGFAMVKFRTMAHDAEAQLPRLLQIESLVDPVFKIHGDPRITRAGRLLRRWSLDELPQLFNVLRGHMSLVGPRPEQVELVERYRPEHRFRLAVRPGVTGPMQVYGRGELSLDERIAVEREYVENLSLGHDLRILLMTASAVLGGRGAY